MAYSFSPIEHLKIVQALVPSVGTGAAMPSDVVSLKNAHKAWIVVHLDTVGGAGLALIPMRATGVAPANAAVLTTAVPIWMNADTATSDTLVRQASAVNLTTGNNANNKLVIFEIDPAELGATAGNVPYDCVYLTTGNVAVTDYIAVEILVAPRYPGGAPFQPTVLTD